MGLYGPIRHRFGKALKKIIAVLRAWACLRMVLHRPDGPTIHANPTVGPVKKRGMRFNDPIRQCLRIHGKPVVH